MQHGTSISLRGSGVPERERTAGSESGVTLVEMVIAVTILGIVLFGVAAGLIQGLGIAGESRHRAVAASLASEELDLLRSADVQELLDAGLVEREITVESGTYHLRRQANWVDDDTGQAACTLASAAAPDGLTPSLLRVDVEVTWPTIRSTARPVTNSTVITPPIELYDPERGHIAVTVRAADGGPQPGVTVSIEGDGIVSRITDANGCAFFAYLDPVTWTITLDQAGYVDRDGEQVAIKEAIVQPTQTEVVEFSYDLAASIETTLVSAHGGIVPPEIVTTVFGPEGSQTQSDVLFENLFPFPSGYNVWGGCSDNSPGTYDATTTTASPMLPGADLNVSVPVPTAVIFSPFLDDIGDGEQERRIIDVQAMSGSGQTACATPSDDQIQLGQTEAPTSGPTGDSTLRVGLPYGPWRFEDPATGYCAAVVLTGDDVQAPGEFEITLGDPAVVDCALPDPAEPVDFTLTATTEGEGTVDPSSGTYEANTSVTVTATPAAGWEFVRWEGDISGSSNPADVFMNQDRTITAVFEEIEEVTLTTSVVGQGFVVPAGGVYEIDTVVGVEAIGDLGWSFVEWQGDLVGGSPSASLLMDADKQITAIFERDATPVVAVWRFNDIGAFSPEVTPPEVGVSAISNPNGLGVFGVMNNDDGTLNPNQFGYPNAPVLRVSPRTGATNAANAVSNNSYIEFTVNPAAGTTVSFQSLRFDAARGGGSTPRGLEIRSSADGFSSALHSQNVDTVRPNLSTYNVNLGSVGPRTTPVTFRLYIYAPNNGETLELDDIELSMLVEFDE